MRCCSPQSLLVRPVVWAAVLLLGTWLGAAEPPKPPAEKAPKGEAIDMFAGMADGQIEVQLIPKDAAKGNLRVVNRSGKPLTVKLPEAFGAAPVLAQIQPGPGRQNPFNPFPGNPGPNDSKQPQRLGGMVGQPLMYVGPEKPGQVKVELLCLDHGKPNPRPAVKYEVKRVDEVTDKQGVTEVCQLLARGEITHCAAQLAAWHFSNGMTWEKLAALRHKEVFGSKPTYTAKEIEAAKKAAEKATEMAKKREQATASR
jgi:hypothetical protein